MNPHPIIQAKNVSVRLGGDLILKNVNLKVEQGETLVVIGPSGGGKTVLLKTLAGIYPPETGHVFCEDEDWQNLKSEEKRKLAREIGVQFQKNALFDSLTTFDNVAFPLREHYPEIKNDEIQRRVKLCLEAVDLWQAKDLEPHELSGGMQLRLGIARALVLEPKIILYDDPTAGLDPVHADKMVKLILRLKKEYESTLVIATHSVEIAYELAGRIVMVSNGEVLETGTVHETQNHPDERVQQFIHGRLEGPLIWG